MKDVAPAQELTCWCGLPIRSTLGIAGVYGHVGKRRPGDTHPASPTRPRRRKPKEARR